MSKAKKQSTAPRAARKPSAICAARDRAINAVKAEKATRLEYQRRHRRADRDPQQKDCAESKSVSR